MALEVWREIETEIGGDTIKGHYRFADETVTVRMPNGSKTTPVGGLIPEYLAKILLRQLARETAHRSPMNGGTPPIS
jgi:hypothetical protein